METIWKPVGVINEKDFSGLYECSNEGFVKNSKTGLVYAVCPDGGGYAMIRLGYNGKSFYIHAHNIISQVFLGERPFDENGYKFDINHIDGNKLNNNIDNLEYISRKENIRHSFKNKLQVVPKGKDNHMYGKLNHWSSLPVKQYSLGGVFIREYPSVAEAGRILGMRNPSNICSVIKGRRPHSFGFLWKY